MKNTSIGDGIHFDDLKNDTNIALFPRSTFVLDQAVLFPSITPFGGSSQDKRRDILQIINEAMEIVHDLERVSNAKGHH
jgi:hypothetical protein